MTVIAWFLVAVIVAALLMWLGGSIVAHGHPHMSMQEREEMRAWLDQLIEEED